MGVVYKAEDMGYFVAGECSFKQWGWMPRQVAGSDRPQIGIGDRIDPGIVPALSRNPREIRLGPNCDEEAPSRDTVSRINSRKYTPCFALGGGRPCPPCGRLILSRGMVRG
jgi:hypothetical protein